MRRLVAAVVLAAGVAGAGPGHAAVARRDLGRDESRGGHTLARHVGRTDDELRARLRRETRIAAASTFEDRATAEEVVAATLGAERDRVREWSRREPPRPNLALDYRGGRPIGRSLRRGRSRVELCRDAVVVLKWRSGDPDFFVLTAYPEVRH
ncbi:MAG: RNase A-like domain-containing protein [Vicinamibacteria bacterium]